MLDKVANFTELFFLLIAVYVFHKTQAGFNDTVRLFNNILKSYDSNIRPAVNTSKPITVSVSFNVRKLLTFVETDQKFDLNAWLNFTWVDEIRTWNPKDYGGIRLIHPTPKDVWRPGILISNSFLYKDIFDRQNTPTSLHSNGLVRWYPGDVFSAYCTFNMTYFPFDEQTCFIRIQATEFIQEIHFVPSFSSIINDTYISNGEWSLISSSVIADEQTYNDEFFSRVTFYMNFKRKPEFFIYNVLIPVILVSFLSPLSFVLPEGSVDRASFSITVLLSLSLFMGMVSQQLPKNSDTFPIMITYLFVLLLHSGACVFATVLHLRWNDFNISKMIKRHLDKKDVPLNKTCQLEANGSPDFKCETNCPYETRSQSTSLSGQSSVEIYAGDISTGNKAVQNTDNGCDKFNDIWNSWTGSPNGIVESRYASNLFKAKTCPKNVTRVCTRVIEKIQEKCSRKLYSTLKHHLADLNVQLFILFNMSWVVISAFFLNKLSSHN
ncbi:unnamed protein product [Candidula unifasciata]|uniref:Uncharacterized protein n=1 Tax=Candidula unifasciata TaxID=100452 RepID=A0A8S3ZSW6_9EUPU|nr:unnamed protein product [Candidula unifasciata]